MKFDAVKTTTLFFLLGLSSLVSSTEYTVVGDHYPPYQYKEHKHFQGFSFDVLNSVLAMSGDRIAKSDIYPWKRALHMLETNQANILISANYSKTRNRFARYPTEPIIITPWYLWKRKDHHLTFGSLNDLLGKKVGVVQGYSYTEEFWDFVNKHQLYIDTENYTDDINLSNLNQGLYDLSVAELGNGTYIKNNLKLSNIEPITSTPIKEDGLYAIFNKNTFSAEFVDKFSKNLVKFKKTPAYHDIYKRYFP